ncbi:hypothetical protein Asp14428_76170 [Actinoplanes sp. NBRC 14428]|uniref:Uncharacterized protein n=1 Tax=Pseudosporangium ferrugineum TaxID=439699 RepID=A0A2T0RXC5_9ACTN|nr:hypothetical protein [Pseudosporangium ferrugineum]PRY25808.1 hypothetical protein CLV70_112174 [Pseudosporangium ferrugineum]BCJ56142.1 hypothetical protein Asp14428_76170 [Actinoplanes sp. NBRC 14428]
MNDDDLRGVLSRAAAEHRPDRTAMLNRIARQRAAGGAAQHRRAQGPRFRIAGAALAVAAVLGAGGVTRWALAGDNGPDRAPVAPPVAAASRTAAAPPAPVTPEETTPATTRPTTDRPTTEPARPSVPPAPTGAQTTATGGLRCDGSVVPDGNDAARSEITVKLTEPVTDLEITVRVQLTPGLTDQGAVHDVTGPRIDSQILHEPAALTYRFTLAAGETLPKGTHVFAAKYRYTGGARDAGDDSYRAVATTATGRKLTVSGDFF